MSKVSTTLRILADALEKKKAALTAILSISENQETILLTPPTEERKVFFDETNKAKQEFIDEVIANDEVFNGLWASIAEDVDGSRHREEVIRLQGLISDIFELDVAIRAREMKNKELLSAKKKISVKPAHTPEYISSVIENMNKFKK